jgi:hypothetical protein
MSNFLIHELHGKSSKEREETQNNQIDYQYGATAGSRRRE